MLDIKNYFLKIMIKIGFKKVPEKRPGNVGISMSDSTNIKMDKINISGFDKGIDAKNVDGIDMTNVKINQSKFRL